MLFAHSSDSGLWCFCIDYCAPLARHATESIMYVLNT